MTRKILSVLLTALLLAPALAQKQVLITKTFTNAEIATVLQYIADQMGKKLVLPAGLQGRVSVVFEKTPAHLALNKVVTASGNRINVRLSGDQIFVGSTVAVVGEESPEPAVNRPAPAKPRLGLYSTGVGYNGGGVSYRSAPQFNTESYDHISETGFREVTSDPLSTFSIDVDTASYSNIRRFLLKGSRPPKDAVRIEEMLNYFNYRFKTPEKDRPFSVSTELTDCPWKSEHQLLQVALAAPEIEQKDAPPRNLVFLLDVSGSMGSPDKLPLLKNGMKLLTKTLRPEDRVAIVVYAGASGTVLDPTSGKDKGKILAALERLNAGGSTNGGAGIELAYKLASENFQKNAINRVILATDGDFNVGVSSRGDLVRLIEEKRESGIFLTVLGFGSGNLKDSTMEQLADKGNGNYAYIDSLMEVRKVLVKEAGSTLITVAKDVKLQLEFNPLKVKSYRLIGYENRRLNNEDFADDKKDAGEMGAGHTVTALYEIVPGRSADSHLRYQQGRDTTAAARTNELALVKVRYKEPQKETSKLREFVVKTESRAFTRASENLRFAASVASAGMLLRDSEHKGSSTFDQCLAWARNSLGEDPSGYRREFVKLMELARDLESGG